MNKPYVLAGSLTFAIIAWLLAGVLFSDEPTTNADTARAAHPLMTVEVQPYHANIIQRRLTAYGNVQPNRAVTVRAETLGRISAINAKEGDSVRAGQLLVSIDMNDRRPRREEAKSLVEEKKRSYEMIKRLGEQGYQAQKMVDESYSALQSARADLAKIELEIQNTKILAPFDGILEKRFVEIGDYAAVNGEIATIVDNDPLTIIVHIPQQDISKVTRNGSAEVIFATGEKRQGNVKFVASRADETTRTFRVELSVANPDGRIPSGTSAETHIPAGTIAAQFVSPALFTLNEAGEIGIKTVGAGEVVEFYPVDIVYAEAEGAWVSGLPEHANVITVGQGFVRGGDTVIAKNIQRDENAKAMSTVQTQPAQDTKTQEVVQ
jgi:membrane fusion protein, multidrug efflux system